MKTHKFIKMLTIAGLVVGMGAPLAGAAETRAEQRGQLTARDYKFLSQISQGGTSEVELGQLAKRNGGSQAVRDFGDRMATDHTKLNNEISQLAASKQVTLPGEVSHRDLRRPLEHDPLGGGPEARRDGVANRGDHVAPDCFERELRRHGRGSIKGNCEW